MTEEIKPEKNKGGRPREEPTKQIRVPVALIPAIENMVKAYKMQPAKQVQS